MRSAPWTVFFRVGSLRFIFAKIFLGTLAVTTLGSATEPPREHVAVAAAANFVYALDGLSAAFRAAEPAVDVTVTTGASGSLVAQIRSGAPYDVFLSADLEYPRALTKSGHAESAGLKIFAVGRLVLWTTKSTVPLSSLEGTIRSSQVKKLAIANLDTAPYGRAAQQALEALGLWRDAQPKLVMGENITQTAQFVETGNADAGFVALSLVRAPRLNGVGRWVLLPASLHAPLAHAAVVTKHGATNPAAARFLAFLHSKAAQKILMQFGYALPEDAVSSGTGNPPVK